MTLLRKVVQLCIDFIVTAVEFADISRQSYAKFLGTYLYKTRKLPRNFETCIFLCYRRCLYRNQTSLHIAHM